MPLTTADFVEGLRTSRRYFLKHADGLTSEQCDWKPYLECKNVSETLAHLILDDRMALASLQSGAEPDYDAHPVTERDLSRLRTLLDESHEQLCTYLLSEFQDAALDTELTIWGSKMALGRGISYLSSEDFYHAGQVSFIRQATDPSWDYYSTIYGG